MNVSWYVPRANVDHTISDQGTAVSILDHSANKPYKYIFHLIPCSHLNKPLTHKSYMCLYSLSILSMLTIFWAAKLDISKFR